MGGSGGRVRRTSRWLPQIRAHQRPEQSAGEGWTSVPAGPGRRARLAPLRLGPLRTQNQRQLARHGLAGWQPETTAALLSAFELSPAPGAFYDVGANGGIYSILCRLLFPAMQVVAFEPTPATRAAAARWAAINHVDFTLEPLALGESETTGTLYLSAQSDASNSLVSAFRRHRGSLSVDVMRLDTYVARSGIVPTVLKIDVERYEPAVVRGGRELIQRHQPRIVVEILPGSGGRGPQDDETWQLLTGWGYQGRALNERDWLFWPGGVPAAVERRMSRWRQSLARCLPSEPS